MVYDEDDLLPISALQHLLFCERQAALIHIERQWKDNRFTLEGSHLHRRVDGAADRREVRRDIVIVRGLALRSLEHGLVGRADIVEFHRVSVDSHSGSGTDKSSTALGGLDGEWTPFPVEYKRGKPKNDHCDEVQLCAQALCLEESFSLSIADGALFYGRRQRRTGVRFDDELRAETIGAASRFRQLVASGKTPRAEKGPKCERCSLLDLCLPEATRSGSVENYLRTAVEDSVSTEEDPPCERT